MKTPKVLPKAYIPISTRLLPEDYSELCVLRGFGYSTHDVLIAGIVALTAMQIENNKIKDKVV